MRGRGPWVGGLRYEEGSGLGVVDETAVEGDRVLCTAGLCVVADRWASGEDPRVSERRWGDVGLEAAAARERKLNP